MSDPVAELSPRPIWERFSAITKVPRPSKHEEKAVEYVLAIAKEHHFATKRDATGNVVMVVPATAGREKAKTIVLQSHLDMVCEKNRGVEHDFMKDPIRTHIDGEWVKATGTTLGADNGMGVAAALAVATDPSAAHGPLELLFTIDEETGLTGAANLDGSILTGRTLLNLDSEDDGVLYVGCAGGRDTLLYLSPKWQKPAAGSVPFALEIRGLRGGHSGLNIHENRGNALKLAARILDRAAQEGVPFEVASIAGGSKHNAIPREADAKVYVPAAAVEKMNAVVKTMAGAYKGELAGIDDGIAVSLNKASDGEMVLSGADRDRLLRVLVALPHGVLGMSPAIPGLVETSNNLAVVDKDGEKVKVVTSSRSSVASTLDAVVGGIRGVADLAGVAHETADGYPGWKPDLASPVLGVVKEVFARRWGKEPKVTAIHAGLECGLLGERVPGMDMVSFGPQIEGAHSPDERVHVPSVGRFYDALKEILDVLSR
jgi:dipeptidase D